MKSYKLNKTFENSIFPVEKQLIQLNESTHKSVANTLTNFLAAFFSGIGTSIAFYQDILPQFLYDLLKSIFGEQEIPDILYSGVELLLLIAVFLLLYFGAKFLFREKTKQEKMQTKKKTDEGREELKEEFHKSIVNNIVMGTSFVSKVIIEENNEAEQDEKNKESLSTVESMYLCEAIYYYSLAERDIEDLKLFDTEMEDKSVQLIRKIGVNTLYYTVLVFRDGVNEVCSLLPDCDEREQAKKLMENIEKYIHILNKLLSQNQLERERK